MTDETKDVEGVTADEAVLHYMDRVAELEATIRTLRSELENTQAASIHNATAAHQYAERAFRAEAELEIAEATLDLQSNASQRAVEAWRKQDPESRRLTMPDLSNHILWAFTELADTTAQLERKDAALRAILDYGDTDHEGLTADKWDRVHGPTWGDVSRAEIARRALAPVAEQEARDEEDAGAEGRCGLCGEPMPDGEEMFKYHGYSGPCPDRTGQDFRVTAPARTCTCGPNEGCSDCPDSEEAG